MWYCGKDHTLRYGDVDNSRVILQLQKRFGLVIVQYKPTARNYLHDTVLVTYLRRRRIRPSREIAPKTDEASLWHARAFHTGPDILDHLTRHAIGVRIRCPTTVQCEACALAKARTAVSRSPKTDVSRQPLWRISVVSVSRSLRAVSIGPICTFSSCCKIFCLRIKYWLFLPWMWTCQDDAFSLMCSEHALCRKAVGVFSRLCFTWVGAVRCETSSFLTLAVSFSGIFHTVCRRFVLLWRCMWRDRPA